MNEQAIYSLIKNKNIWFEITEHPAVYNMHKLANINLPYPNNIAKNLFLVDDKKGNYYLITLKGDKKVNLKTFRKQNSTRPLSLATKEDLLSILNLTAGSVSPFGLLNDQDLRVTFYLDKEFLLDKQIIGIHPNNNTKTLWLKVDDLINIIKEHGNFINIVKF